MTRAARREGFGAAVRTLSRPRWLLFHLIVVGLSVAMVLLGRWQLQVSNRKHFDLQNFGYSLQWWAFTACGLFAWVRIMRDRLRSREAQTVPSSSGQLVRTGAAAPTTGPALLVRASVEPGGPPVVYRGYVLPSTAAAPVRSHGDSYHDSYNDYLWQLSLADSADSRRVEPADRGLRTVVEGADGGARSDGDSRASGESR